ncbi:hypothetical protein [Streptomyces sp. NRRL B-24720]|uniref:hypothetical protein n=1 Tax=Streptomyces sp. NRRL B-24720 TaxID=1476876 RepID=UPI000AC50C24|nr:hypothetical protein [Streptomyces sp. NRRL B-24720]
MNTFQIIQLAMTAVFAISATVVGVQAHRGARIAQDAAGRAEAAERRIRGGIDD